MESNNKEKLAIHGGFKVNTTPFDAGKRRTTDERVQRSFLVATSAMINIASYTGEKGGA